VGVKTKSKPKAASGVGVRAVRGASSVRTGFDLVDMLGQAGWVEADEALAQSLQDFQGLSDSVDALAAQAHALDVAFQDLGARVLLARQSLEHVARRRGLERFGDVGVVEPFDPRRHDLAETSGKTPAFVRVRVQGVVRGRGPKAAVLVKAAAERAPAPRKAATRKTTPAKSSSKPRAAARRPN